MELFKNIEVSYKKVDLLAVLIKEEWIKGFFLRNETLLSILWVDQTRF